MASTQEPGITIPKWSLTVFSIAQPFIITAVLALFGWIFSVQKDLIVQAGALKGYQEAQLLLNSRAVSDRDELWHALAELSRTKDVTITTLADILARVKNIETVQQRDTRK